MLRVVVFDTQWTIKMYYFINFVISLSIFTILAMLQTGMNTQENSNKMSRFYPKCMFNVLKKLKSLKQHIKNGQNQAIQFITSEM